MNTTKPSTPVTQRVRKVLATKGELSFGDLYEEVKPASKFAVRSALAKDRERGDVAFEGGLYSLVKK